MKFILAGMTLNFFFLNFWGLNWILPLAGAVLLILGFRSLWGVSRWFQTGYNLSVIRLLLLLLELVGNWGLLLLLQLANAAVMLSLCFFLWKGLQEVLDRVDPRRGRGMRDRAGTLVRGHDTDQSSGRGLADGISHSAGMLYTDLAENLYSVCGIKRERRV